VVAAGYSGTALPRKLGLGEGHRVLLKGAPAGFAARLGRLPPGARLLGRATNGLDLVLWFSRRHAELARGFDGLAARLTPAGMLWIAWPKKSSGVATDLFFGVVQRVGLDAGLVDSKICAIDDVWSGLRFVHRLRDRRR